MYIYTYIYIYIYIYVMLIALLIALLIAFLPVALLIALLAGTQNPLTGRLVVLNISARAAVTPVRDPPDCVCVIVIVRSLSTRRRSSSTPSREIQPLWSQKPRHRQEP